jgi:dTDP-4-amino-4,6-dideoxygalactose transaminase
MAAAVAEFERAFAAWLGLPFAVAAGFGRSALRLALAACGVRGCDVLAPEFICGQVLEAVRRVGGRPALYPVERDLQIDPGRFIAALTSDTRAAIVPHYFGRALPQMETLAAVCRERDVLLIEDCALALGALHHGRRAGTFGDVSIFSLTKSDWCYGGGVATAHGPQLAETMRHIRDESFVSAAGLARCYGRLRRADFLSNCPRWSRAAEVVGRRLERAAGFATGNFYDAGGYEEMLEPFAAERASTILRALPADSAARCRVWQQLRASLHAVRHILPRPELDAGDNASFFLLQSPAGRAAAWQAEAAPSGVTLRLTWPAYQPLESRAGASLAWFADHLLFLEIHPRLCAEEIERIAACLRTLGGRE